VLFERGRLDKHEIEVVLAAPKQSEPEFRRRQDGYISPPCLDARTIGAYHEAGHAAVAVALNQTVRKLLVNPPLPRVPTTHDKIAKRFCISAPLRAPARSQRVS
jgi:hypothetical protein